jgi:hypothetical protein
MAGWNQNPDGKFLRSVNPPGSPYVVIVGKDGRIKNQWFGIAPASAGTFVTEFNSAVDALINPPVITRSNKPGPIPSNSGGKPNVGGSAKAASGQ